MKKPPYSHLKLLALLGALTTFTLESHAVVINFNAPTVAINFNAAQGYTNGYLNGQAAWTDSTPIWQVDTNGSGAAVCSPPTGASQSAKLHLGANAFYSGYAGSVVFSFNAGADNTPGIVQQYVSFGLFDSGNSGKGPEMEIKLTSSGTGQFSLYNNVDNNTTSGGASLAAMGLNSDGTGTSSLLELAFSTDFVGIDPSTHNYIWRTVAALYNLSTGSYITTDRHNWTTPPGQGVLDTLQLSDANLNALSGTSSWIKVYQVTVGPATTVFNFTAAGGYINGPLNGQGFSRWADSTSSWQVNTNGTGAAILSAPTADNITAKWTSTMQDVWNYEEAFDFSFTLGANNATTPTVVTAFQMQDMTASYHGPQVEIQADAVGAFELAIYNSITSPGPFISTPLSGTGMGLNAAGTGTTAPLRLNVTTTYNGIDSIMGANYWTTVATLTNLNTGALLGTLSQTWTNTAGPTTQLGQFDTLVISEGNLYDVCGGNGALSISQIAWGPLPASVINFTAAGGYTNGSLPTQANWTGATPGWQVNTSGGGNATISSTLPDFTSAVFSMGAANALTNGHAGSCSFSFTLGAAPTSSGQAIFDFVLEDSANGNKGPSIELKPYSADTFTWDIYNDVDGSYTTANLSAGNMGLNADGSGTSSPLKVNFTTTFAGIDPSSGSNTWTTVVSLINAASNTVLGTLSQTWINTTGVGRFDEIKMDNGYLNDIMSGSSGSVSVSQLAFGPLGSSVGAALPAPLSLPQPRVSLSHPVVNADGFSFTITFTNALGQPYDILSSTNVTGPWTTNNQGVVGASGTIIYTNQPPLDPHRFFRVRVP